MMVSNMHCLRSGDRYVEGTSVPSYDTVPEKPCPQCSTLYYPTVSWGKADIMSAFPYRTL